MTPTYPVALDLAFRRAVVIGGGAIAIEKARGLVECGAVVTMIAADPGADAEELAAHGAITLRRRGYWPGDLEGMSLAIDASEDEWTHATCAGEARTHGVLLNVVDRPEYCDFHAPAIVRRGPLRVAISTSGESPAIASALRARLERLVGDEWEPLTALVGRTRRGLRSRRVPRDRQERAYGRLLRPEIRGLLRSGQADRAESLAVEAATMATTAGAPPNGRVALVGAGPGDPGLLTLQAVDLLATADVVLHDALIPRTTLRFCGDHARVIDAGKRHGRHGCSQDEINAMMIAFARQGLDVVRLKGGDPFVFGRGGEEMAALVEAGVDVMVVPGVSSALAAPEAAGIPVTMRGVASSVAIVSGHQRSLRDRARELVRLRDLAASVDTLVVLMPLTALGDIVAALTPVVGSDRMAALVSCATWERQRTVTAPLDQIEDAALEAGMEAPATLVVGDVVRVAGGAAAAAVAITAAPAAVSLPA